MRSPQCPERKAHVLHDAEGGTFTFWNIIMPLRIVQRHFLRGRDRDGAGAAPTGSA